ncbi:MAG TPA: TylF/MycF/NovP-related O-methyltransferase [Chitinophagaceae bacterium]|nr:TylF/MycF/NovP-related O-methyltransferase [Chitinophagaceae bacterium]
MMKFLAKGANYLLGNSLRRNNIIISNSLEYTGRNTAVDKNYFDKVRLATLELVSFEINSRNIEGNVAELGVYKGKFARYINKYFPERSLYLFDTFGGFDRRDILKEQQEGFSDGSQDFSDTSVNAVMQLMPFPAKCIPKKGFFPESAQDINDTFSFVSIDTDLYEPIYNGLKFFYPRLAKGGYIFVHDFNNNQYKGSRRAVEQFCAEQNIGFVPLPDAAGSAIIVK